MNLKYACYFKGHETSGFTGAQHINTKRYSLPVFVLLEYFRFRKLLTSERPCHLMMVECDFVSPGFWQEFVS